MTPLISAPGRELLTRVNELPNKERDERESRDRNRPDSQNRPYNRCDNQKHGGRICAGRGVPNFPIVVIGHRIDYYRVCDSLGNLDNRTVFILAG